MPSRGGRISAGADVTTVLVVEDEFGIMELLDSVLTDEGYRVLTAANGKEGLELLARERPQLVISDLMMPVMDGAAMLDAMAADPTSRGIPVVMISSLPETDVAGRCSGYVTFVRKPFRLFALLEVVDRLLGQAMSKHLDASVWLGVPVVADTVGELIRPAKTPSQKPRQPSFSPGSWGIRKIVGAENG